MRTSVLTTNQFDRSKQNLDGGKIVLENNSLVLVSVELVLLTIALILLIPIGVLFLECTAALLSSRSAAAEAKSPRPKVAVLIPAYNEAAGIAATISTILLREAGSNSASTHTWATLVRGMLPSNNLSADSMTIA